MGKKKFKRKKKSQSEHVFIYPIQPNNFSHEYPQCSFNVGLLQYHTTKEDEQAINLFARLISLEPVHSAACILLLVSVLPSSQRCHPAATWARGGQPLVLSSIPEDALSEVRIELLCHGTMHTTGACHGFQSRSYE